MNKSDLVAAMAAKTGDTKKSAEEKLLFIGYSKKYMDFTPCIHMNSYFIY